MGHSSRILGLLRSLAIYHAIPLRQRRLRRLYSKLLSPGELVFDLGAHAGNRTRAFVSLGCRVVAIEPQPDFARLLRTLFIKSSNVTVLEEAVGDQYGYEHLLISERTPTVTTLSGPWHKARFFEPGFSHVQWNRQIKVKITTLDKLIEEFGIPAFIKIDVEGSEPKVLAGLNHPIRALSFEYLPSALDYTRDCIARLNELGPYRFNWSIGESYELATKQWIPAAELLTALAKPAAQYRAGDVYALLNENYRTTQDLNNNASF